MIVDAWLQHPTRSFLLDDMFASLRRWMTSTDSIPDEIPVAATLAAMDAADVSLGLISAWAGPTGAMISNAEVAATIEQAPDRFVGVASVDIRKPVAATRELRRCVRELGFRAVRLIPWLWELPPDDRLYYPIYAECVELGIPFCTQAGHAGPLRPSEPGRPIPYLDRVACDFPELKIVAGHIGYPWTEEMIALARKYEHVYIDTSAYKTTRYPASLIDYMNGRRGHKVLFGSNYPMLTPKACLEGLDALELSPENRAAFLGGNAMRVFGLPQG